MRSRFVDVAGALRGQPLRYVLQLNVLVMAVELCRLCRASNYAEWFCY